MIKEEITKKYKMCTLEEALEKWDGVPEELREYVYYIDFLKLTDHIPNKIIEAKELGREATDYKDILEARQFARDEINRLETLEP